MYQFTAIASKNRNIAITSNTYWSCKAEGNFKLSKYDGNGSDTIDVIIPEDEMTVSGTVYFSYGDERCKYPELDIYYTNNCLIRTTPTFIECGGNRQKTIFFHYKEKGELFTTSVLCMGGWTAFSSTLKYLVSDNDVTVISGENDGIVYLTPNGDCNEIDKVEIRLVKNPD